MTEQFLARIRVAGFDFTAPIDLVAAAGWSLDLQPDGAPALAVDRSSNQFVTRRFLRAASEWMAREGISDMSILSENYSALKICVLRCVEFGEIEGAEARRHKASIAIAEIERDTASAERDAVASRIAAELDHPTKFQLRRGQTLALMVSDGGELTIEDRQRYRVVFIGDLMVKNRDGACGRLVFGLETTRPG